MVRSGRGKKEGSKAEEDRKKAATAVMALVPAFLIALFGQKYVIRGLRFRA